MDKVVFATIVIRRIATREMCMQKMFYFRLLRVNYIRINYNSCHESTLVNSVQQESLPKIKKFWENERLLAANLNYESLTEEEKLIHDLHQDAIAKGHFTYYDPKTNERILTRLRHYLRGKCCGNACRHCVYDHDNVIDEHKLRVRRFNSSFWTYPVEEREPVFDESCYFNGAYLKEKNNKPISNMKFKFNTT